MDQQIVVELQRDARRPVRDIARTVGVAASTCFERIRRLHETGTVLGYHAEVDLAAVGRRVQALVSTRVRPLSGGVIDRFERETSAMPQVMAVFVVAGGDDFLLHVGVSTMEDLHSSLVDTLSRRKEVVGFRTSMIFRHRRNPAVAPLL
ncbi:Lrp/AsnC family transcriptional regulator [Kineococcus indalonis]|uniref:Lrp/AsnC family transcriptional regulator n=1 Tax=Kineococcus indalonis TaxID=2696566 RepID=UPI00141309DD|nr:Lrp/AsnC family transcriptional regulator [Kineococcus indalonis]NAZ84543.1 AsnC family transcriptional regulator [Kineococcus indalonis]